jgi:hypothetical protein
VDVKLENKPLVTGEVLKREADEQIGRWRNSHCPHACLHGFSAPLRCILD